MSALCFGVERKHFETELLEIDDVTIIMYISLKRKFKMTGDCCVFKSLQRIVDGKTFIAF